MRKPIIILGAATFVTGLLLAGCGKQTEQQSASKNESQPAAQQAQSQTPPAQDAAKTYAIDWCVVSGEKLGGMGPAVDYTYKGRQIKFCCKSCIKTFEKNPDRFLAKLDSATAGLIKAPAAEPEAGSGG